MWSTLCQEYSVYRAAHHVVRPQNQSRASQHGTLQEDRGIFVLFSCDFFHVRVSQMVLLHLNNRLDLFIRTTARDLQRGPQRRRPGARLYGGA